MKRLASGAMGDLPTRKTIICGVTVAATICLMCAVISRVGHISPRENARRAGSNLLSREENQEKIDMFFALWQERHKRDVSSDLFALLKKADYREKNGIALALGRLKNSDPQKIARMLSECKNYQVDPLYINLAQARMKARSRSGEEKLNTFAKSIGLSWLEVCQMSRKSETPFALNPKTPRDFLILAETVDLLRDAIRSDNRMREAASALQLGSAQQLQIATATFTPQDAAQQIVTYAATLKAIRPADRRLIEGSLLDQTPEAILVIEKKLSDMYASGTKFHDTEYGTGHYAVFMAAAATGDRKLIPLIQKFGSDGNPWIAKRAKKTVARLTRGQHSMYFL